MSLVTDLLRRLLFVRAPTDPSRPIRGTRDDVVVTALLRRDPLCTGRTNRRALESAIFEYRFAAPPSTAALVEMRRVLTVPGVVHSTVLIGSDHQVIAELAAGRDRVSARPASSADVRTSAPRRTRRTCIP